MGNSRAPTFREHDTRADTDVSGNHNTLTPNEAARAALAREAPGGRQYSRTTEAGST